MDTFLLYLLKVNFAYAILYLFYKLAFTKDTFFNLRRFVLLAICLVSFLYPFVEIPGFRMAGDETGILYNIYTSFLPEVVVSGNNVDAVTGPVFSFGWTQLIFIFYFSGISFLLFRTVMEGRNIYREISGSTRKQINGLVVHINTKSRETYSFLKWITLSPDNYSDSELNEILTHEQTHVREWHSLDIILIQTLLIFNWFNPFVWLLRKEIRINHEYLADRSVIISGYNKKNYQYHLIGLGSTHQMAAAKLYNNFSVLPLKNRLKMLNKKRTSNIMISKYLMLIPVLGFLLVLSNCAEGEKQEKEKLFEADKVDEVVVVGYGSDKEPAEFVNNANPETVLETAEVMPEYPGGHSELMRYLSKNIKYPTAAQDEGIQGRIVVQFIIEKDGSINEVNVSKSVHPSLDKEAERIIKAMPAWTPGKNKGENVRVRYSVPIVFRLQ